MKKIRILVDPSLWILIAVNLYLVWYYYHQPTIFTTLIWLYWAQSVMLGAFNFLDMLTIRKVAVPDAGISDMFGVKRYAAFFFLFHYGGFHLVYFIFLFTIKSSGPFQLEFFKYCLMAFFVGQMINFIQHKIRQRTEPVSLGKMFFIPYLRVVPMHLTILLPNFFAITNLGIFLVLKSIADVLMYLVTINSNRRSIESEKAVLATEQGLNM